MRCYYNLEEVLMENIIELNDVTFEYDGESDGKKVIENFNLSIEKGSFTVILGHNGSGKSTLAKLFNGLYKPTLGTVLVDGLDTTDEKSEIEIKRRVGLVFQNPDNQLIASIVEEDVAFGPENLGLEPSVIRQRVDNALKSVDMFEFAKSTPHRLSGGQKQRIAIAGIIAMEPECIVLDEPTAMLDPKGRKEIIKTIERLNKENNITVVLITHFMEEAENADRVIVMDSGKIILDSDPKTVFCEVETLKRVGLDVPQTSELLYQLELNGININTNIISIEEAADEIISALHLEEN